MSKKTQPTDDRKRNDNHSFECDHCPFRPNEDGPSEKTEAELPPSKEANSTQISGLLFTESELS